MVKKNIKERQWLNLMIILVSAMFMMFVLAGKIMNDSKIDNEAPTIDLQQPELVEIDFGYIRLVKRNDHWINTQDKLSEDISRRIALNWESMLDDDSIESVPNMDENQINSHNVLLFFKDKQIPLMCKVVQSKEWLYFHFIDSN
ncbi:MAG: hypothetical protein OEY19_05955 [Gammaproteobacteria bacterium]|nr:hypothetical protein [Gammaproteobacteria bacterium]